ncbi:hypothetical protein G6M78_08280 [Agrobacterium tumefaciens]|uniref:hypothetical protein n=1 Tax=Agrobacterium tumefaciens TaxID=358 RepID=UPI001573F4F5|nr:hypothetical protein [Agrobacterium tumefaciens]NTE55076.1 hypothetical protein [Agrobacterium tumefaciens]NTE73844.1 hypothetical protein [Agrobacterium tumefaciens]
MPSEQEKREFLKKVRAHKAEQPSASTKRGDRIDRAAIWKKAMKSATAGPRVRVEGE